VHGKTHQEEEDAAAEDSPAPPAKRARPNYKKPAEALTLIKLQAIEPQTNLGLSIGKPERSTAPSADGTEASSVLCSLMKVAGPNEDEGVANSNESMTTALHLATQILESQATAAPNLAILRRMDPSAINTAVLNTVASSFTDVVAPPTLSRQAEYRSVD
jgi:hypothetical protein